MQDLVIICAGEFGEEMVDNLRWINEEEPRWNLLGFIDDGKTGEAAGVPVLGTVEDFLKMDKHIQYFVATLDGKVRERIITRCKAAGFRGAVILGERATVEEDVVIGESTYVGAMSVVQSGAKIGEGCILEHGNTIGMDAVVGDYTTSQIFSCVCDGAVAGKYTVQELRCTIDAGVKTLDGCSFVTGTVMLADTPTVGRYQGVPGKLVE